jgi:D-alanyl-lipoteichoic acid acyltransferase DltB (MBOAT superfamily)
MLFNSFIFLFFLALVVPAYYLVPRRLKNPVLLVASYVFYGYWDWRFTGLLLASTIMDFFVGLGLSRAKDEKKRKLLLVLSVATGLVVLGFFKYFNFFVDSFNTMISGFGWQLDFLHINVILPVGISFYTFQTMTYTIDIYRRKLEPTRSFIDFALYVAFFPQLVAGPIERASHLLPQMAKHVPFSKDNFREGIVLISVGMFRKVLIGDTAGRIVDQIFAKPHYYASIELLMGIILFSLQVYHDFSGYSLIARGTAKMFGKDLMINFRQPFLASNITDVWRRWHISLSSWFRDYLYIPLGGSRKGPRRAYVNLMVTMALCGLWHGAAWNFVLWGVCHGVYLAIHRLMLRGKQAASHFDFTGVNRSFTTYVGKVIGTNVLFLFALLIFRAKTFGNLFYFWDQFFVHWTPSDFTARIIAIVVSYIAVTLILDIIEYVTGEQAFLLRLSPPVRYGIVAVGWFFCLVYLYQAKPLPFVYFQF